MEYAKVLHDLLYKIVIQTYKCKLTHNKKYETKKLCLI